MFGLPNGCGRQLWRIFSSKSAPTKRKKGFYIYKPLAKEWEIGGIFVFSGSEL
jgi:hypothetical protein